MKILINRTDAIGDTLLSIPLARLIKLHYPNSKVAMIVSGRSADLVTLCEGIDFIYKLDIKKSKKKKWQQCSTYFEEFKPDYYFHMGGDFTPSAMAFFKRIPFRGGLVSKVLSFIFLNKGIRQSRSLVEKHESEYNMDLAQPLGITWDQNYLKENRERLSAKFILDKKEREVLRAKRFNFGGRGLIFIHPGMSGHTLNWPDGHYASLANRLYHCYSKDYKIVVSYTPSDERYIVGMRSSMDEQVERDCFFFDGSREGLIDFTHALSLASLFIGPSTGTTHMANALRLNQVALYSPIKVQSKKRWGPFVHDERVAVFSPSYNFDNNLQQDANNPMASIEVDEVFKTCQKLLDEKGKV